MMFSTSLFDEYLGYQPPSNIQDFFSHPLVRTREKKSDIGIYTIELKLEFSTFNSSVIRRVQENIEVYISS